KGARKLASAVRASLQELERRQMLSVGANPTAVTGGPYVVNEGSSVVINGTSSSDSDGTIATYKWDLNYTPALGFRTSVTGGSFTYHASDGPASRTIALRVIDNDGNQDTQTTTLTTNN